MDAELLKHIELLAGSIGVMLGLFFSLFLLSTRKNQPKANFFLAIYLLAFSLRIGKSLFHNYFDLDATLRTYFLNTLLCVGPSIWLYTQYHLHPKGIKYLKDYFHFIPFVLMLGACWAIPNNGSKIFGIYYDFLTFHMFCYTMFSIIWLARRRKGFKRKSNPKLFTWLCYFLFINLALIVLYFLISEAIIPFYIGLSFLFSVVVIFFSFWALKNPFLFRVPSEKYKHSNIDSNEASLLMTRLRDFMVQKKPYLNPDLSLPNLSEELGVSKKELSQAINQIESLNYSQFVSKYRVQEVQRLMKSPSHSKFTIAALAYDSGFSSISSFNSAFKKHTQTTAIAYRKSLETS